MAKKSQNIVSAVILSIFEDEGPVPKICHPEIMEYADQLLVSMKSISLLMGEQVYQEGKKKELSYFGILPFPDLGLTGLTYFFLIFDKNARGKAKASTISLMVNDIQANFLYENMKQLSVFLAEAAIQIQNANPQKYDELITNLFDVVFNFSDGIQTPLESIRTLKVLFTGLDASGKTSFLKAVRQKYSELTGIKPTKGIERTEQKILGQSIVEWDVGGQQKYRTNFLKEADIYIFDTNLLFYLVDIQDKERFTESVNFLKSIIENFRRFNQFPPIIVNFHKYDPDMGQEPDFELRVSQLSKSISDMAPEFQIHFNNTSIFDPYSLIKAFSEGLSSLSPNREIFENQLEWLASEIHADSIILLNENSIILSDYSSDDSLGKASQMAAPHFQTLFKVFAEFKLLKRKYTEFKLDDDIIIFYNFVLDEEISLFLLCLAKTTPNIMDKLTSVLDTFQSRISPLIKGYL